MANHGVTSMAQVEDMKVVLEAYWAVASKRIAENICMVFETHLLNAMGDDVEAALLNLAQRASPALVEELCEQDPGMKVTRQKLKTKQFRLTGAVTTINELAPGVTAVSPRYDTADAAPVRRPSAAAPASPAPGTAPPPPPQQHMTQQALAQAQQAQAAQQAQQAQQAAAQASPQQSPGGGSSEPIEQFACV